MTNTFSGDIILFMKWVFILCLFYGCVEDQVETTPKVMSWNVRCDCDQDENKWENRKFYIENFIIETNPSFLVFQEISSNNQKNDLEAILGDFNSVIFDERSDLLVAVKGVGKFEIVQLTNYPPRAAIIYEDENIKFIGTHTGIIPSENAPTFREGMIETANILLPYIANSPKVIVAGDFNHLPYLEENWPVGEQWLEIAKTPFYGMMLESGLVDNSCEDETSAPFNPNQDIEHSFLARIDWILHKNIRMKNSICPELFRDDGNRVSDHRPIIAEIDDSYDE